MYPSVPDHAEVAFSPEIRETAILDDVIPETTDPPQPEAPPQSTSTPIIIPSSVLLEAVDPETSTEPAAAAPDPPGSGNRLSRHQSGSFSQGSVDEEVPVTDIYFVSLAFL